MLTGVALRTEATRLAIPGRSRMTADQLRAAILAATTPPPAQAVPTTPWRSRNGKRKSSIRTRRGFRR